MIDKEIYNQFLRRDEKINKLNKRLDLSTDILLKNKSDKEENKISIISFLYEFFNNPPTESIFRVYILSFIIWNKSVILYIIFGSQKMEEKLLYHNWSYFTYCQNYGYLSLYLGPIFIAIIIYIFSTDILSKRINIYNYGYILHKRSKANREIDKS